MCFGNNLFVNLKEKFCIMFYHWLRNPSFNTIIYIFIYKIQSNWWKYLCHKSVDQKERDMSSSVHQYVDLLGQTMNTIGYYCHQYWIDVADPRTKHFPMVSAQVEMKNMTNCKTLPSKMQLNSFKSWIYNWSIYWSTRHQLS